ncbi:MAG: NADH-quinone oxidoreductase subunit L [Cyclobacteriaceae bacterium]
MSGISLTILILSMPLLGGLITYAVGAKKAKNVYLIGPLVTMVLSILLCFGFQSSELLFRWEWLPNVTLGIRIDHISSALILLVSFVSLLVHLFSSHYMSHDGGIHRYYAKLGFFTTSMLGLLMADHLLLVFVFWELVGFSSYLLIGFWFQHQAKSKAAKEAFMVNRIADAGLLIGVLLLIGELNQSFISELSAGQSSMTMHIAGIGLLVGVLGKSAQFPFFGWLPKAMAGPTPVSALIHAATMVAAGVYLAVRVFPIFTPPILTIAAVLGAITAFMAAYAALTQFDIKKVLAYSTISQLGYMVMGVGVGAYQSSLFHLWTHAFFKAGLFLGAGAVLHYFHELKKDQSDFDPQDMRNMGGLRVKLPVTFYTFLICGLALSGLPLFSGFLSKEGILTESANWASLGSGALMIVPILGLTTAVLTPYYVGRQILFIFGGQERTELRDINNAEPMFNVKLPLIVLTLCSLWIFHAFNPLDAQGWWLSEWLFGKADVHSGGALGLIVMIFSIVAVLIGLYWAYRKFGNSEWTGLESSQNSGLIGLSWNAWYIEQIYDRIASGYLMVCRVFSQIDQKVIDRSVNAIGVGTVVTSKVFAIIDREVIDGVVNFAAWLSKLIGGALAKIQSGKVQNQLVWLVLLVLLLIVWLQF